MTIKRQRITRFDGGMTADTRNTERPDRAALISHFDIYSDPNRLKPMPSFTADNAYSGAGDISAYGIRAVAYDNQWVLAAVGLREDGAAGWQVYFNSLDGNGWRAGVASSSTAPVIQGPEIPLDGMSPFIKDGSIYFQTYDGTNLQVVCAALPTLANTTTTLYTSFGATGSIYTQALAPHLDTYMGNPDRFEVSNSAGTSVISSRGGAQAMITQGELLWILSGYHGMSFIEARGFTGTTPDPADTYVVSAGRAKGIAIGSISGNIIAVLDEFSSQGYDKMDTRAGRGSLKVVSVSGSAAETLIKIPTTGAMSYRQGNMWQIGDTTFFYASIPMKEGVRTGVWAIGRRDSSSPVALSHYLDTTSMGDVRWYSTAGNKHLFINTSGEFFSINDASGAYTQPSTYRSILYDNNRPGSKKLKGVVIEHEELPVGQVISSSIRRGIAGSFEPLQGTSEKLRTRFLRTTTEPTLGNYQELCIEVSSVGGSAPITAIEFIYEDLEDLGI